MAASALDRIGLLANQLAGKQPHGRDKLLQKNPDDIVITLAIRTPLTKARKGGFRDTTLDDLLIGLLKNVRKRSRLDPSLVEDVCVGNVLAQGPAYIARSAVLAAGFPVTTTASVANRFCSSGLLAVQQIANQIIAGAIDIGLAVGAESMSTNPDPGAPRLSGDVTNDPVASQVQQPMGQTSENVAHDFHITRAAMDAFAASSFQKAEHAQRSGWFDDEIAPIAVAAAAEGDPATGRPTTTTERTVRTVSRDDGIRYGTTAESLGRIRAAFPQWAPSHTTGGNASQITDGAAAILLMKRSRAVQLGQPIVGKFAGAAVVGLEPRVMGIGPALAIPKMLGRLDISIDDVDVFEINEAFASMAVYCVQKLGLDAAKVNPRGGAIALGHPLGCTGARQIVTALSELKRSDKRIACTSMCIGTGMGMAGVIVSEH